MMAHSFTPGPWKHEVRRTPFDGNRPVHHVRSDHPSTGYYVATCDDYHADDENEANARLIAAAPALLAACKTAVQWIEDDTLNDLDELSDDAKRVLEILRAAIALAEPEPQPQVLPPLPHDRIDFFGITGEELGQ